MDFEDEDEPEDNSHGVSQGELIRGYLSFGVRAVSKRRWMVILVFLVVTIFTVLIVSLLPASYHCEMKLTALRNQVLEDEKDVSSLAGSRELIKRHDNLIALVNRADLVHRWDGDRPPITRLKDRLSGLQMSDTDRLNALVYMLDQRLSVSADDITLTIGVDWPQAETAARIVDAAEQSFLEARHIEEISTIQEKISILDHHASKVREEIDTIAEQLERLREEKLAEANKVLRGDSPTTPGQPAAPPRRAPRATPATDEELPRLKEELETKKKSIADLEAERMRRLADARSKLEDIRIRFTPAHPAVVAAEQAIKSLSEETPQVTSLRSEVQRLEADLKDRAAIAKVEGAAGGGPSPAVPASSAKAEVLPSEIMKLLDSGAGVDPTASSHLGSAVAEYTRLHEAIRTKRISLDTAQAAFNHRYRILAPVEIPNRPSKSKATVILGGGLAAALVLALLSAILFELRTGVIVDRWQVLQMQLPILGELRLPPGPND